MNVEKHEHVYVKDLKRFGYTCVFCRHFKHAETFPL